MEHYLVHIALVMLLYCLFSARIGSFGITMPMVFLGLGVLVGIDGEPLTLAYATAFHHLAEVTLALLLFADATTLRRDALDKIGQRTGRMLLLGLPFAILLGAGINLVLLPDWPLWEVCLLAALLAPTDAALGQSIQSNTRIPQTFRDAMNAESGLNDGLALPFVIFFAGMAISGAGAGDVGDGSLLKLVATQIGLGAAVGVAGGFAIGKLRNFVLERELMDHGLGQVATLILVAFIFFAAEHAGGNSFVAVFVAGIAYANAASGSVSHARHFLEGDGQFLAMLSFFFIGALFVPEALEYLTFAGFLVVILSLVLVRPVAIWLSLMGTDTSPNERLFYGWFGPRGLATALFAVFVVMDFEGVENIEGILVIAITAVLISAFVHGITAKYAPEIFRFGDISDRDGQGR
ncbi:sodium/proton antiporter (CPA1 family) [Aliiruegeria haliotis]|uniref:Sodium/proton antiporter (CPA1 family) n=1 Tax=Aliiruegeria haliotis TaxID=1280846 RepID=A0A2T0S0N5_9RHOB|nr:cation:proton antiporter [Aliiruegeria haliotis]PRY26932.1 sodium/proton antiporter (CPA1 family) [Aliiruegeria haliotis]